MRIKVQNWADIEMLAAGIRKEPPRCVDTEALVDTGASGFYLKESVIRQLGLRAIGRVSSRTMSNLRESRTIYSPVDLEIQGRSRRFDVVGLPDELPNVVGQIPLEAMDWVLDLRNCKVIPNLEHKGEELYEEF